MIVDVGKRPGQLRHQDEINALLLEHARRGRRSSGSKAVIRSCSGEAEKKQRCCSPPGSPSKWCPGSRASAAPASAGVPVTHRGLSSSVTVVSGHVSDPDAPGAVDWEALAATGGTW